MDKEVWKNQDLEITHTGESYLFKDGVVPPIHDFVLESLTDEEDFTFSILSEEYVLLWISYDLDNSNVDAQKVVKMITDEAKGAGIPIYELSASSFEDTENFKQMYDLDIEVFSCDATTLKTIVRSNPGLIILNKGTVIGKYPFRRVNSLEDIRKELKF
jgi:hypothetical protein